MDLYDFILNFDFIFLSYLIDFYLIQPADSIKIFSVPGTCLVILSFPLIFETCTSCNTIPVVVDNRTGLISVPMLNPADDWLLIFYYVALIVLFQIGWAVVQISHLSLIPDLNQSQRGRAELTAIRYA